MFLLYMFEFTHLCLAPSSQMLVFTWLVKCFYFFLFFSLWGGADEGFRCSSLTKVPVMSVISSQVVLEWVLRAGQMRLDLKEAHQLFSPMGSGSVLAGRQGCGILNKQPVLCWVQGSGLLEALPLFFTIPRVCPFDVTVRDRLGLGVWHSCS